MQMPLFIRILGHIITLVMAADLIVRWRSAGSLREYGAGWLLVDLLAALPFGLLTGIPVLDLVRLVKLGRLVQTMRELWSTYIDKWNTFRLLYSGLLDRLRRALARMRMDGVARSRARSLTILRTRTSGLSTGA